MRGWLAPIVVSCTVLGAAGCRSHWTAETTQPLIVTATDVARSTSLPLTIEVRDMELNYVTRYRGRFDMRLANTAYYVALSRDRLRFHVTLRQKFETMSDLRTWETWVEDDRGAHHEPEQIDEHVSLVGSGRQAFYVGTAAFTVYGRDLLAAGRRITLVLRRPHYEYRYRWNSEPDPDLEPPPTEIELEPTSRQP